MKLSTALPRQQESCGVSRCQVMDGMRGHGQQLYLGDLPVPDIQLIAQSASRKLCSSVVSRCVRREVIWCYLRTVG